MSATEKTAELGLDTVPWCRRALRGEDKVMFSNPVHGLSVAALSGTRTSLLPKNWRQLGRSEKRRFLIQFSIGAYYGARASSVFRGNEDWLAGKCESDDRFVFLKKLLAP